MQLKGLGVKGTPIYADSEVIRHERLGRIGKEFERAMYSQTRKTSKGKDSGM